MKQIEFNPCPRKPHLEEAKCHYAAAGAIIAAIAAAAAAKQQEDAARRGREAKSQAQQEQSASAANVQTPSVSPASFATEGSGLEQLLGTANSPHPVMGQQGGMGGGGGGLTGAALQALPLIQKYIQSQQNQPPPQQPPQQQPDQGLTLADIMAQSSGTSY
jgi:septal ring factor EnvC (AmiA/AmiB activator)